MLYAPSGIWRTYYVDIHPKYHYSDSVNKSVPHLKSSPIVCLFSPPEFPPSRLILKNDNVISAPFISHARAKRFNSLIESSQTPRPYLPCWANIVLKSHAPIVMDESCMAQLDRRRNYNGTLCPCRSPFELLKCLQRKRPKYILSPFNPPQSQGRIMSSRPLSTLH